MKTSIGLVINAGHTPKMIERAAIAIKATAMDLGTLVTSFRLSGILP